MHAGLHYFSALASSIHQHANVALMANMLGAVSGHDQQADPRTVQKKAGMCCIPVRYLGFACREYKWDVA